MRRLMILLFSVTLLAAACGDDDASEGDDVTAGDDDADAGDDDDNGDDDAGDDDDDAGDDDDDDDNGDDDAGDDDDDDGDPPTGDGVGSDFCATYNETGEGFNPQVLSPEEIEAWYRDNLETMNDVRGSAPGEIRDDVDTLFASFVDVIAALEEVDWDFTAIDETDPVFDNPEAEAATERVEAFCDDGSDDDEIPFEIPGLDPDDLEDLQDQFENPEEIGLQFYELLGHDEETAQCLLDELGADFDVDDAGADIMTQEFCGLTLLEILGVGFGG